MGSIHEKNRGKKSRATVPLMLALQKKPQLAGAASWDRNPEVRSLGGEAMAATSATALS